MKTNQVVVIRQSKFSNSKKKSSGAWKIAFADFTLAMMAFFMVMWILEVSNEKEREEIATYMRERKIFAEPIAPFEPENSPFPVDLGGTPSAVPLEAKFAEISATANEIAGMSQHLNIPSGDEAPQAGKGEALNSVIDGDFDTPSNMSLLTTVVENMVAEEGAAAHIEVDSLESGLRVVIKDTIHSSVFERGQTNLTPFFEDLMIELGGLLANIKNGIVISGHTDGTYFRAEDYSNWELSGDRAQIARKALEIGGMPGQNVVLVNAYGSTRPINVENRNASENRRIELLILTDEASQQLSDMFSYANPNSALNKAANKARQNEPSFISNVGETQ
ncbi:flagellar motor protein MotB [Alteromonas sp. S015]|uniref:flagellar motor protein MotB n=1 Tax=Alteromonas sp. S015 TaxID=3117401 RepID=UPI002FE1E3E5